MERGGGGGRGDEREHMDHVDGWEHHDIASTPLNCFPLRFVTLDGYFAWRRGVECSILSI